MLREEVHALTDGWMASFDAAGAFLPFVGDRAVPSEIFVFHPESESRPHTSFRIRVRRGIPVCTDLELHSPDDDGEILLAHLRIPLDDLITEAVAMSFHTTSDDVDEAINSGRTARRDIERARRGRRRSVTPELLAEVAQIYRANINDRPIQQIRRRFGVSERTAARYVQLCRPKHGGNLLPDTEPGRKKA
ncbi:hypothetical protein ACPXB3_14825 [Gordonia sp. DT219]|uniref:hypothetical protein n=1 Tax=Gordonia sp. DT219 TaxID=3416658 RepID=UPI003CF9D045